MLMALACIAPFFTLCWRAPAQSLDRVMTQSTDRPAHAGLSADRGHIGLYQQLLKLRTTASLLHTTAHPDDEHAGMLTYASRGLGARIALLSINRGEAGANAIGSELFDALGLIRTEELRISGQYYGLDDLYFTSALDYGYSKTLDETLRSWDRETVLRDMVRVMRINRPLVVVGRFHGSQRDGHGNHQAVGGITPEAVAAAGNPSKFPEQITEEGLQPWTPLKLYRGGVHANELWHIDLDVGQYSPWLGDSYQNFGSYGLSLQRSQTSGRSRRQMGSVLYHYERLNDGADSGEGDFFHGLDTSLSGLFNLVSEEAPEGGTILASRIDELVEEAFRDFDAEDPSEIVSTLAEGLRVSRELLGMVTSDSEVAFLLRVKEQQFMHAIRTAMGIAFSARAMPSGSTGSLSPWAPVRTLGPVVPGQSFRVEVRLQNHSAVPMTALSFTLVRPGSASTWSAVPQPFVSDGIDGADFIVEVPEDSKYSQRYFFRRSIRNNHYEIRDSTLMHLPAEPSALVAEASFAIDGEAIIVRQPVQAMESNLPYGYVARDLKVAPALAVNVQPSRRIVPSDQEVGSFMVKVEVLNNHPGSIEGELSLNAPDGWTILPDGIPFSFAQPGQRQEFSFDVTFPQLDGPVYTLEAVASAEGRTYAEGYVAIRHRDLAVRHMFEPAQVHVHGLDVQIAADLSVGYIKGVGDEIPDAISQLGADVFMLTSEYLASGDLSRYHAIVVGTRAYAVRQDLVTYNARLLDYAAAGGNLIVLYQTQEFVPDQLAPYPAQLPRSAEEVSEQDAPVTLLAPEHPVFQWPNAITMNDFDGWVEQRGSKFFTEWDDAYTPLLETHDTGQAPQRGAWLIARHGIGFYTYFAIAIHRQTPYAVPGPYRIFANLLSMGAAPSR